MKQLLKHSVAMLMALVLCFSLLPLSLSAADAATVEYVYDSTGKYIYNWGTRSETATFLSPNAEAFYTGENTYNDLSAIPGGTNTTTAPNSALYKALQDLMTDNHSYVTSYDATKNLYQYTDCQNSGKDSKAISSFYSGTAIGPAWGSSPSWNREHTWPNSKGLGGRDENDIMMLRPTASSENSSRSNKAYGKSSGFYNPNAASNNTLDLRGDVSRIFLYVYVRWGNVNGNGEYTTWGSSGVMESLDVLLEWMEADPVDTWELGRNDSVESITGTRNVFVDYPEFAFLLFGEEIPDDMATPSGEAKNSASCDHNYEAGTPVAATCTEEGYTPYVCSKCSKSYKDNFTTKIAHTYTDGACSACGAEQPRLPVTGEKVVIYAPAHNMALSANKVSASSYYNKGIDVSGGFSGVTAAETWVVTVNDDGSYSFVSETGSKLALAASYSSLNDTGAHDKWTLTAKTGSDSLYYVKNVGRGNYLEWYASMNNWSTYSTSNLTDLFEISFYIIKDCIHEYSAVVVDPTCTEDGYTTYTCGLCGHSYEDDKVTSEGHDYKDGFCTVCDEEKPEEPTYTIHFLVPTGVTAVAPMVCDKNGVTLPTATAPTGYTFLGWTKAAVDNVTAKPAYTEAGKTYTATADTVLYALYTYDAEKTTTITGTADISFANKAQRTEKTSTKQVWQQNGITVTNDKAASTTAIGDYANPARFYASSKLTVAYPKMTKIEFTCGSSSYATALKNSISGATFTASGSVVTVTFSAPVDSFVVTKLSAQVRVKSIKVTYSGGTSTQITTHYTTVINDTDCAHATTSFVDAKEANCLEEGKKADLYCSVCKKTLATGEKIDAKGHVEAIDKAADPSCTESGWTEGKHCKRCKEILIPQTEIEALKHIEIVDKGYEAKCTEPGLTDGKHCDRCKEILVAQEPIEALKHIEIVDKGTEATCTEPGLTDGKHCDRCDEVLVEQEPIEALGHNEVIDAAKEPTCDEPGLTEGKHCDRCDTVLVAQEEVDALEHADVDGDGLCDDCDAKLDVIVTPPTGESSLPYLLALSGMFFAVMAIVLINKKRRTE